MLDIRKRTGWLFFCVMLAQVILVSAQVQSKSGVRVLELVTFELFSRVERATSSAVRGVRDVWGNYASLRGARDENEVLRRQLSELQIKLQEEHALAVRSQRLQELMDLRTRAGVPTLAAEVIGGNPNPGMKTITIDREVLTACRRTWRWCRRTASSDGSSASRPGTPRACSC